jgi:hypothetical protein
VAREHLDLNVIRGISLWHTEMKMCGHEKGSIAGIRKRRDELIVSPQMGVSLSRRMKEAGVASICAGPVSPVPSKCQHAHQR